MKKVERKNSLAKESISPSESGFAQVTVELLAERAGRSKNEQFAHFGSKEEIQPGLME